MKLISMSHLWHKKKQTKKKTDFVFVFAYGLSYDERQYNTDISRASWQYNPLI